MRDVFAVGKKEKSPDEAQQTRTKGNQPKSQSARCYYDGDSDSFTSQSTSACNRVNLVKSLHFCISSQPQSRSLQRLLVLGLQFVLNNKTNMSVFLQQDSNWRFGIILISMMDSPSLMFRSSNSFISIQVVEHNQSSLLETQR